MPWRSSSWSLGRHSRTSPTRVEHPSFADEALVWLPDVTRFALSLTRDQANADNLIQDTFLRAYQSWDTFIPGSACRGRLFTMCRKTYCRQSSRGCAGRHDSIAPVAWTASAAESVARVRPGRRDRQSNDDVSALPVVLLLDAKLVECARWGQRPAPLKQWVREERQALSTEERYRESRRGVTECCRSRRSRKRSTPSSPR